MYPKTVKDIVLTDLTKKKINQCISFSFALYANSKMLSRALVNGPKVNLRTWPLNLLSLALGTHSCKQKTSESIYCKFQIIKNTVKIQRFKERKKVKESPRQWSGLHLYFLLSVFSSVTSRKISDPKKPRIFALLQLYFPFPTPSFWN